jgi:predicted ATPase/DNA-binding CsgD family transcriptional regulator
LDNVTNLPALRTALIGRRQAVDDVCGLLRRDDVPLVTLTGSGGVGKTRLALQAAADLAPEYAHGVRLVELAPLRQASLVLPSIARAYGLDDRVDRLPLELLIGHLNSRRMLLVLDNFEHLLAAAPEIADLLGACPGLTVLATSRAVLHLSGEHEVLVHPLPRSGAVQLFVARARAADAGFALTATNAPVVTAICDRLDGLPLAIELAAARVRTLPLAALLTRLDVSLTMLTGGARDQPDRHRTMRDAITWSHDLLVEREQVLFRRLAVFVDGFDLRAAAAVTGFDDITLLDGVTSLVENSLLTRHSTTEDAVPRFRMLEVVREYGAEQLDRSGDENAAQLAHASHYVALAEGLAVRLFTVDFDRLIVELDVEHGNIRAALTWCDESGFSQLTLRLARAMSDFWWLRGHLREGQQWIDHALQRADRAPSATRAGALASAGWLSIFCGDISAASTPLAEAVEMARLVEDRWVEAASAMGLAIVNLECGDVSEAAVWSDHQLRVYRELAPTAPSGGHWLSIALGSRGQVAIVERDMTLASAVLEEGLALQLSLGFFWGTAETFRTLGDLFRDQGRFTEAQDCYRESVRVSARYRDLRLLTHAMSGLAVTLAMQGDFPRAARLFGAATTFREHVGSAVSAWDHAAYDRGVTLAKSELSIEDFASLWSAGAALSTEAAIDEALAETPAANVLPSTVVGGIKGESIASSLVISLTPREMEILRLLADGLPDREIAAALSISLRTVNGHVTHLLTKLGVESRTAAATLAVRNGLA